MLQPLPHSVCGFQLGPHTSGLSSVSAFTGATASLWLPSFACDQFSVCCSPNTSKTVLLLIITYVYLVSAPDPHVTPARKRVWYLTSDFLVVLTLSHECQVELRNSCSHADSPQPRKQTLDTRPSFVRESREGLGPRLTYTICMGQWVSVLLVCVPKAKAFLCMLVCVSSFVAV